MMKKFNDKLLNFFEVGIPEKIANNFDISWPVELINHGLSTFVEIAKLNEAKEVLADLFLTKLLTLMNNHFKNKKLINNSVKLLRICSDSIEAVDTIFEDDGNEMADRILQNYLYSEPIILNNLY